MYMFKIVKETKNWHCWVLEKSGKIVLIIWQSGPLYFISQDSKTKT